MGPSRLQGLAELEWDTPGCRLRAIAEDMRQTPLIVANHICYIDGFILAHLCGAPKVVCIPGTLNTPVIGTFASEIGAIAVDRSNRDSRNKTKDAINEHVTEWQPGDRPLLLF